jgi:hypothetical protein
MPEKVQFLFRDEFISVDEVIKNYLHLKIFAWNQVIYVAFLPPHISTSPGQ